MAEPNGIYKGRLACDGYGNLLADEGEHRGLPVAYHEGSFVFVAPGEPSHNERHHKQFAQIVGTNVTLAEDPDAEGCEHHDGILEDDPHYDENAENNTKLKVLPDAQSVTVTGHTDAWS